MTISRKNFPLSNFLTQGRNSSKYRKMPFLKYSHNYYSNLKLYDECLIKKKGKNYCTLMSTNTSDIHTFLRDINALLRYQYTVYRIYIQKA
jgi:hypothetical protein